jgi:hypothetical protein
VIGTFLSIALLARAIGPDRGIEGLEKTVAANPRDLDAQLELAIQYSWAGDLKSARAHAMIVVNAAPSYKDAQLLIARIDAWEGDYPASRRRLRDLLVLEPEDREVRGVLLDVETWAGNNDIARKMANEMIRAKPTADLYYRLAQIDYGELKLYDAYREAGQALELDPTHEASRRLRDDVHLVMAETVFQAEKLPGGDFGHAEILTVTALPRNHLSLTATEEFRHRFGTDNNRVALQFDWRQSQDFRLTLLGAFGAPATVVPRATGSLRAALQVYGPFDIAIGYTFDALPIPAELSRVRVDGGLRFLDELRAEASYTFGFYTQGGSSDETHAVQLRTCWEPSWGRGCAFYAYGAEIIGPITLTPSTPLSQLTSHVFGGDLIVATWSWLDAKLAGDAELRNNGTHIYRLTIGGRVWF